jgi:hypothetical protein
MTDYRAYSDTRKASQRQEKQGAERFGGTVNAGSGNGDLRKNDVRTARESIEFKTTTAASFVLRNEDLAIAWTNAFGDDRRMVFGIEFAGRGRVGGTDARWVVLEEDDYLEMKQRLGELEEENDMLARQITRLAVL